MVKHAVVFAKPITSNGWLGPGQVSSELCVQSEFGLTYWEWAGQELKEHAHSVCSV